MRGRDTPPRGEVVARGRDAAVMSGPAGEPPARLPVELPAAPPAERRAPAVPGFRWAGMVVTVHSRDCARELLPDWRALHARTRSWSPFADPDLQLAWCSMFVPVGAERIVAVRRAGTGELAAVLPFFAPLTGIAGRVVRYLRPFGGHHEALINEMPEIGIDPEHARAALAAVVAWLAGAGGWDFVEFSLRGDQPWVEARWLVDAGL